MHSFSYFYLMKACTNSFCYPLLILHHTHLLYSHVVFVVIIFDSCSVSWARYPIVNLNPMLTLIFFRMFSSLLLISDSAELNVRLWLFASLELFSSDSFPELRGMTRSEGIIISGTSSLWCLGASGRSAFCDEECGGRDSQGRLSPLLSRLSSLALSEDTVSSFHSGSRWQGQHWVSKVLDPGF